MPERKLRLGAFLGHAGHHRAAWLHKSVPDAPETSVEHFLQMIRAAERGLFDLAFLADSTAPWGPHDLALQSRTTSATAFEPVTLLSALSMATRHIGLVATSTTTFDEPYLVARKFASLDQLSGGRAGWNLVTSSNEREAYNFGKTAHVAHADRYDRASEFADVVLGLWDSWDQDAFVRDRASGRYFDPRKMHQLDHAGKHFSVKGPLNIARSLQGRPIIVQAGSSEPGRQLAARTADIVFTVQQQMERARDFVSDIKNRAAAFGRSADSILVMPGLVPVVGRSRQEAQDKMAELDALMLPDMGVALLSSMVGTDLSTYPIDGPLPDVPLTNASQGRQQVAVELARKENLTIRQLYKRLVAVRAHFTVVGTATEIADHMEDWFKTGAADGFNIMPTLLPQGLVDFVDHVVPELQRRDLYRTAYEGRTLRANLGLPLPVSRYVPRS